MSEDEDEAVASSPKTSPYYRLKDMLLGNVGGHNKEVFKELAEKSRIRGLRNKDTCSKTTRGLTVDEQVGAEEKWISENIADTDLHDRLGIKAYAKVLDVALLFHLQEYIDDSLFAANAKLKKVSDQVVRLGTPPSELDLALLQKYTATTLNGLGKDVQKMSELESTLQFNGASTDIEKIKGFYLHEDFTVKMIKDAIAASVRSVFKSDTEGQFRLCRFDDLLRTFEECVGYLVAKHFDSFKVVGNRAIDTFDTLVLLDFGRFNSFEDLCTLQRHVFCSRSHLTSIASLLYLLPSYHLSTVKDENKMSNLHSALAKALVKYIVEPVLENLNSEVDLGHPEIWESPPIENDADDRAQCLKQLEALEKIIENWEYLKSNIPTSSDNGPKSPIGKQKRKAAIDTSEQDGRATRSTSKAPKL